LVPTVEHRGEGITKLGVTSRKRLAAARQEQGGEALELSAALS
jgi:hypothetical protein